MAAVNFFLVRAMPDTPSISVPWVPSILEADSDLVEPTGVLKAPSEHSFAPTDIFVYAHFPMFDTESPYSHVTYYIGTLMMLSISSHRDKFPVAILGRITPVGYTAGHRTVAGSMGFHIFDYSVVEEMGWKYAQLAKYTRPLRLDEFPPFDMTFAYVSEEGAVLQAALRGVTILDDGYALQIDDPTSRVVLSYMALDYEPPTSFQTTRSSIPDPSLARNDQKVPVVEPPMVTPPDIIPQGDY